MENGLPPLEFTDCVVDSPFFRENLHIHEKELERTSQQIKRLIKDVKDLLNAAKSLSFAQRKLSRSLENFTFTGIGTTQTDDERVIQESLKEFGSLIAKIEDVRDKILQCSVDQIITPLEKFRKEKIGKVKEGKKRFERQTAKFCQSQEKYLNISTKKQDSQLKEADANLDMEERELCHASLQYVFLLQEVEERKKFEFVETFWDTYYVFKDFGCMNNPKMKFYVNERKASFRLLSFLVSWLAFYHQGHEVYGEFKPYMTELQLKIQKTRDNFEATRDKTESLMKKMLEMRQQKSLDPTIVKSSFTREGYLYLMEKKAFGTTWTKQYCRYKKDTKEFEMIPYNQMTTKSLNPAEKIKLASCTRRMSDSIEKRFCFDLMSAEKPGIVYTLQALSEADRKMWLDAMDGKEPTYASPGNLPKTEERQLDENGINFVKKCIETLEARGLEEQGLYRIVGVNSKVNKLLSMGLDRRKMEKLNFDDPYEWESKTITSALKNYLRNLPEPLMTYRLHDYFIEAAKKNTNTLRINAVHTLVHQLPQPNLQVVDILIRHLTNVAAKSEKNLMSISNLGVCFGPTLLRPEEETVAAILNIKFCNIVVEIMIENYEKIFKTEPEVMDAIELRSHSQSGHREGNQKFSPQQQQQQPIYGHVTQGANGGGSNQASPSSTPHIRAPPRHMFVSQQNPVTHTVIKTIYKEGPATVNLSSSLGNVPSGTREKEYLSRGEQNSSGDRTDLGHTTSFWSGTGTGRVASAITTFSESNLHSMNAHPTYDFVKSRPSYPYSTAVGSDRQEAMNSNSSSNESVSSRDGHDLYGTNDLFRKEYHTSDLYQEPEFYKRSSAFRQEGDLYGSSEVYSSSAGIPKKSTRHLGIHSLPLYRPQPDNVIPFSYSSHTSKFNISRLEPNLRRVRTLYACLGESDGELSFDPNQIITNVRPSLEPGWLVGTLNGKTGLIPENYVEILP